MNLKKQPPSIEDGKAHNIMESVQISFTPRNGHINPYWEIVIPTAMNRNWIEIKYIVDGVTAAVNKSEEQRLIEF